MAVSPTYSARSAARRFGLRTTCSQIGFIIGVTIGSAIALVGVPPWRLVDFLAISALFAAIGFTLGMMFLVGFWQATIASSILVSAATAIVTAIVTVLIVYAVDSRVPAPIVALTVATVVMTLLCRWCGRRRKDRTHAR